MNGHKGKSFEDFQSGLKSQETVKTGKIMGRGWAGVKCEPGSREAVLKLERDRFAQVRPSAAQVGGWGEHRCVRKYAVAAGFVQGPDHLGKAAKVEA